MSNTIQGRQANGNARHTLVIMAKAPTPGTVKTRLARTVPELAVAVLYRCLLDDTIMLARSLDDVEVALMCPEADTKALQEAVDTGMPVVPQTGIGLAAALASVFTHFGASGSTRIVAFNTDTPHLPRSVLESAFQLLGDCDLVVGPTHDGGYYLVGAKVSHQDLFSTDAMGTATALEVLLARGRSLGLSIRLTDPFYDIDVAADLKQLAGELQLMPENAPKTAQWLSKWIKGGQTNTNF
jgi:hypothetical protein